MDTLAAMTQTRRATRRETPTKGDRREQGILDAAEALLEKEGVEPVTVEQIALGAGISRASLYFYFGSKQEVVTALVDRTIAVLKAEEETVAAESDAPPEVTIERVIRRVEELWIEHRVVMRAAVENSPMIPAVKALWDGTILRNIKLLEDMLIRAGVPDDDGPIGARRLAKALAWMSERNFYVASGEPNPEVEIPRTAQTLIAIWQRAMSAGPTP
jgi:AcrR family transcriptional regulator